MEYDRTTRRAETVSFHDSGAAVGEAPGTPYARSQTAGIGRGQGRNHSGRFHRREIPIYHPRTPDAA